MSAYDRLAEAGAAGDLAVARAVGTQVDFEHRDEGCVTLWCIPEDETISVIVQGGVQTQERTRVFRIPVQSGFSLSKNQQEPAIPGDKVKINGREYHVLEGGVSKESNGGVYALTCVERRRHASGVRG